MKVGRKLYEYVRRFGSPEEGRDCPPNPADAAAAGEMAPGSILSVPMGAEISVTVSAACASLLVVANGGGLDDEAEADSEAAERGGEMGGGSVAAGSHHQAGDAFTNAGGDDGGRGSAAARHGTKGAPRWVQLGRKTGIAQIYDYAARNTRKLISLLHGIRAGHKPAIGGGCNADGTTRRRIWRCGAAPVFRTVAMEALRVSTSPRTSPDAVSPLSR